MFADRLQGRGGDAAALLAIGVAAELAGCDAALEVGRDALGGLAKMHSSGDSWWCRKGLHQSFGHPNLRISQTQILQRRHDRSTVLGQQTLGRELTDLRRVQTEPDRAHARVFRPVSRELLEISRTLTCCRVTVQCTVMRWPWICLRSGRRSRACAAHRAPAAGHRWKQRFASGAADPFLRYRPDGAGHQLCVDTPLCKLRQDMVELAKPDERLAPDDREVQGAMPIDEPHHAVDERLSLQIPDIPQGHAAPEMVVAVGVAAGAAERTFPSDFDRERRTISAKDAAPRA